MSVRVDVYTVLDGLQFRAVIRCSGDGGHCDGMGVDWVCQGLVPVELIEKRGLNDALWYTLGRTLIEALPSQLEDGGHWASVGC